MREPVGLVGVQAALEGSVCDISRPGPHHQTDGGRRAGPDETGFYASVPGPNVSVAETKIPLLQVEDLRTSFFTGPGEVKAVDGFRLKKPVIPRGEYADSSQISAGLQQKHGLR
jgi:hypothetical protein